MACITTPSVILIGEYFDKRKAIAHGLSVSLAGAVGAAFPPILLFLFEHYGFTGTMLILTGIGLNCCVGGMLYRPFLDNFTPSVRRSMEMKKIMNGQVTEQKKSVNIQENKKDHDVNAKIYNENDDDIEFPDSNPNANDMEMVPLTDTKEERKTKETKVQIAESMNNNVENDETKEAKVVKFNVDDEEPNGEDIDKTSPLKRKRSRRESIFHETKEKQKFIDCSLLKNYRFVSFTFVIFNNASVLGLTSAFIMVFAMEKGVSIYKATSLLTINSITGSVGTLILGFVLDFPVVKRKRTFYYAILLFIVGFSTTMNPLANNYLTFAVISFARGAVGGSVMSQRATICVDILGRKKLRSSVGLILFATALGILVGRTIGGKSNIELSV